MARSLQTTPRQIYDRLFRAWGPQHWWPARTPTEVVVGAILTQNTAWTNVERAVENLRRARALSWRALRELPERDLAELIRPAGAFRVKAKRLEAFADHLWRFHRGSFRALLGDKLEDARRRLVSIHGIGPETADAILLYAGDRPSFVVDAYALRVLRRHFLFDERVSYETVRRWFHMHLPADARLFNEYHALLVELGKRHCRRRANCEGCPLADLPHDVER